MHGQRKSTLALLLQNAWIQRGSMCKSSVSHKKHTKRLKGEEGRERKRKGRGGRVGRGGKGKEGEGKVRKGGEKRKDYCIIVAAYCTICHPPVLHTNPLHRTRLQVTPHTLKCV